MNQYEHANAVHADGSSCAQDENQMGAREPEESPSSAQRGVQLPTLAMLAVQMLNKPDKVTSTLLLVLPMHAHQIIDGSPVRTLTVKHVYLNGEQ